MKYKKYKTFFILVAVLLLNVLLASSCIRQLKELSEEEYGSGIEFIPTQDWEKMPQTYSWLGGPEDHDNNIERALQVNATVIGRGSWAASSEEWEYLEEEINEAHKNDLIYLGYVNLLGLSEFSNKDTEEYKSLYSLEGSEAVDINGEIIPHIVSEIGASKNVSSYNLLDPNWQDFIKSISVKIIDAGADGIYYDDFNFGEYIIGMKGEFSELTMQKFRDYLKNEYTSVQLKRCGIAGIQDFNYAGYLVENYNFDSVNIENFSKGEWRESFLLDFSEFLTKETTKFLSDLTNELKIYGEQKYNKELKFTGIPSSGFMMAYSCFPFSTLNYVDIPSGHIAYIDEQLLFEQQRKEIFFPQKKNIPEYKTVYALTDKPKLASVSDMTVSLLEKQKQRSESGQITYENFIHLAMAEAFASKGQFFDINYPSADSGIISEYNNFYLNNREMFIFPDLESTASVAVIYPASNYRLLKTIDFDHRNFYAAALALTDLNIQYDVHIAGDGLELCHNELDGLEISDYEVIIMPGVTVLSDREVGILLSYAEEGGKLILLGNMGAVNEKGKQACRPILEDLKNGWNKYGSGDIYLSKDPVKDRLFYFDYTENAVLRNISAGNNLGSLINNQLSSRTVLLTPELDSIIIQIWQDSENIYIHLLNYNFQWEGDVIKDVSNIEIKLNFPEGISEYCVLSSPDFEEDQILDITDSVITIPRLHIWDIVVVKK